MARYQVYLHIDLVEAVPKSGVQRQRIMDFVRGLQDQPRAKGDYTDKDASLRLLEQKLRS